MGIIKIGQMDNSDGSHEIANRVYSPEGSSPCVCANCIDAIPKIIQKTNGIRNRKQMVLGTENKCVCMGTMEGAFESVNRVYSIDGLAPTQVAYHTDAETKILIKENNSKGFSEMKLGGVCDLTYPSSTTRRGRVQNGGETCPTITAEGELHRIESLYRIRKLTPHECWRLMGFSDEDFKKAEAVNSNTQLYKQAGNSIVKDVLCAIFRQMNIKGVEK